MTPLKGITTALGLLTTLSLSVEATVLPIDNLLINGGFESSSVTDGTWQYYTDTHNAGSPVEGWSYDGSGMEIWDSLLGVVADEGEQLAELNAHGANGSPYSFWQEFDTIEGQTYNYGFAYRARQHDSEAFYAGIEGIINTLFEDHTKNGWSFFSGSFVAGAGTSSTLRFTSDDNQGDTTGNLLDSAYVVSVPEPGSLALLGLGLLGLGYARRKQSAA